MKKTYIIIDAGKKLLKQINNTGMIERTAMSTDPVTNSKGLSAVIPTDNDGYCTVYKMDCTDGLGSVTRIRANLLLRFGTLCWSHRLNTESKISQQNDMTPLLLKDIY